MPPKRKIQAIRPGFNKYGFRVRKPENGRPVQKAVGPSKYTQPKASPSETKPKATPKIPKVKQTANLARSKEHVSTEHADDRTTALVDHSQHPSFLTISAPSHTLFTRKTAPSNTIARAQVILMDGSPSSAAETPASTPFVRPSATKSAVRASAKATLSFTPVVRSKVTKSRGSSFKQTARLANPQEAASTKSATHAESALNDQLSTNGSRLQRATRSIVPVNLEASITSPQTAETTSEKTTVTTADFTVVAPLVQPFATSSIFDLQSRASSRTTPTELARSSTMDPARMAELKMGMVGSAERPTSEAPTMALDGGTDAEILSLETSSPKVLAVRSLSPMTDRREMSRTHFERTPSYIRQLQGAAHSPDTGIGQTEPMHLDTDDRTIPLALCGRPDFEVRQESTSVQTQVFRAASMVSASAFRPAFTLTSSIPKLVMSSGGYDEYVMTTTIRVPHGKTFDPPQVSIALPTRRPALGLSKDATILSEKPQHAHVDSSDDSSDDEPLMNRVAARTANHLQNIARTNSGGVYFGGSDSQQSSLFAPATAPKVPLTLGSVASRRCPAAHTAAAPKHLEAVASEEQRFARRKPARGRTPTPFRRGSPFHRLTPSRLRTPARHATPSHRLTPFRRATPDRPRPAPLKSTTVRRKEQWKKTMSHLADYQRCRQLPPRRPIFQQAVRESIALARLETFWKILSDLIANKKVFDRGMWDHWENLSTCVRLINERLVEGEKFGGEESEAAAKELTRQRMVIFTGNGKLMLTRNALSTRLS
ncbi:hypothetical protein BU25DRAFT_463945 [Macroventuria anomochaeta]|uniref:Uncharacterized protein n=1 Tax=Macroventuria anomochaeta TaxID=301207 RepID=A0ACB6RIY9_9PLEO|nr:uncharacterized protein BU25DRAFT_463945 [Macroventuria anomochaeta]KAF2621119.1 hypothetical protein BU25DRAFT_463945 [Macroventuria anomochaeta]